MTVRTSGGTVKTKTQVLAAMTENTPNENKTYVLGSSLGDLYQGFTLPGKATFDGDRALAFKVGHTYTLAQINRFFPTATFTSLTPSTGLAAAGGTAFTIVGTNLSGVSGVTFGGTAATSVVVVDDTHVTGVTPAKTAGTYNVVIQDDTADVTVTNGATFV